MGGEREQLESVEEILMGDEKFLSGGEPGPGQAHRN